MTLEKRKYEAKQNEQGNIRNNIRTHLNTVYPKERPYDFKGGGCFRTWIVVVVFYPRHDPVLKFLFAYITKRTIEFTLSWK